MSKKKVVFTLLFIASISLLNIVVLIEASNQGDPLLVDPFEQQPVPAVVIKYNKYCNQAILQCDIYNDSSDCVQLPRNCYND